MTVLARKNRNSKQGEIVVDWQKVEEIVVTAEGLSADERGRFVFEQCGDDAELRGEVDSLLGVADAAGDFLEHASGSHIAALMDGNSVGRRFGNYEIVREIGYGGMGAVYLARRVDGHFDQQIALKIVRQSIADSRSIERFGVERQILATLNHPNIARLLDGGVSDIGEPFLAMEYVDGKPITDFVFGKNLTTEETLRVFLKVCQAVSYAHRNLVVHRDLKPGNILVTADGEPKLLDFGLAKIVDEGTLDGGATKTAFRALTPSYASPEQLLNQPITTSSDVYSLGIIFYELLTGTRPFDFDGKSLDEIISEATEREPSAPSAVVGREGSNLKSQISNLKLNRDLDNIALTALRKEPERRYQTVEAFARDIERFLNGLPVTARPNTLGYRAEKYFKRHKVGVVAASMVLLTLIGGIVVSLWQTQVARGEKAKAEKVNAFLAQMLNYSDPDTAVKKDENELITVKDVLDKAANQIESEDFSAQSDVKARLNHIIGNSYYTQGFYESAEKHYKIAIAELTKMFRENHPEVLEVKLRLGGAWSQQGKRSESDAIFREIIPTARTEIEKGNLDAAFLAHALENFATNRRALGNSREAEELLREAIALEPLVAEKDRSVLSVARGTLSLTLFDQGKIDEAIATQVEHISELRKTAAAETWEFGYSLTALGQYLIERQRFSEADEILSKGELIYRRLVGNSHLFLGDNLRIQAHSLYHQGKFPDANLKIEETLKIYRANTGSEYINYATALMIKGLILNKSKKSTEAEKILREAVRIREDQLPPDHFLTALARSALGECLATQKKLGEAEILLTESLESLIRSQGPENPRTVLARNRLKTLNQ